MSGEEFMAEMARTETPMSLEEAGAILAFSGLRPQMASHQKVIDLRNETLEMANALPMLAVYPDVFSNAISMLTWKYRVFRAMQTVVGVLYQTRDVPKEIDGES